jgi:flagellar basal body rod protein FlgG
MLVMKKYFWLLLMPFLLLSCDDLIKSKESNTETKKKKAIDEDDETEETKPKKKKKKPAGEEEESVTNAKVLHNITVRESGGLEVAQAYLSFESGNLVPKSNRVPLGMPVYLNLVIKDGWVVEDGTVSIDANEKIVTDKGQLVLDAKNLFRSKPTVDENDANRIFLKANITKTHPDIGYFVVNYHVWDKRGDGEVKGSYKLFIEPSEEE